MTQYYHKGIGVHERKPSGQLYILITKLKAIHIHHIQCTCTCSIQCTCTCSIQCTCTCSIQCTCTCFIQCTCTWPRVQIWHCILCPAVNEHISMQYKCVHTNKWHTVTSCNCTQQPQVYDGGGENFQYATPPNSSSSQMMTTATRILLFAALQVWSRMRRRCRVRSENTQIHSFITRQKLLFSRTIQLCRQAMCTTNDMIW